MSLTAPVPFSMWLMLASILFSIGAFGFLIRRDPIVMFMCVELMLTSSNLLLVAAARYHAIVQGQVYVFFIMAIAAAEVAVGLGIIVAIYRQKHAIDVDQMSELKG